MLDCPQREASDGKAPLTPQVLDLICQLLEVEEAVAPVIA